MTKPKPKSGKPRRSPLMTAIVTGVVIVLVFIAAYIAYDITVLRPAREQGAIVGRLTLYCFQADPQNTTCYEWSVNAMTIMPDKITACHNASPTLDAPFQQCLMDEGISP